MLMVVIASLVIAIQLAGYQKIAISVDQKRSNIASQKEVKRFLVFQKNSKQLNKQLLKNFINVNTTPILRICGFNHREHKYDYIYNRGNQN